MLAAREDAVNVHGPGEGRRTTAVNIVPPRSISSKPRVSGPRGLVEPGGMIETGSVESSRKTSKTTTSR
jgi:hypothetical protein